MYIDLLIFHLKLKKEQWITVTDCSMNPTLYSKNQIKIISSDIYNKGDIVVFRRGDHLVIHRIVYINETDVYFKGDNNNYLDYDSKIDKIIGKVSGKSIFSKSIATLSYNNSKNVKSKFLNLLLLFLCRAERLQRIIAHNLKVDINAENKGRR